VVPVIEAVIAVPPISPQLSVATAPASQPSTMPVFSSTPSGLSFAQACTCCGTPSSRWARLTG
jgi:hypothetical protein